MGNCTKSTSRSSSRNSPILVIIRHPGRPASGCCAYRARGSLLGWRRSGGRRGICRSPFSGTVSKISAQAGQTIQVNDVLLVLEAMKMETVITAPIAGKVTKVNVNVGDAVQQGG